MNFFKKMKIPAPAENIIKDYGIINECRKGIARFQYSVFLVEKYGQKKVIIRENSTLIGTETKDFEFNKEGAARLQETLSNALRKM